jgi:hypothetical protein
VVRYEYKLFKTVPPPPELPTFYGVRKKTVIDGLVNDYAAWEKRAQEAMDDAMRKKSFPLSDQVPKPVWSGFSSDGIEIQGYFRKKQIATFFVEFP